MGLIKAFPDDWKMCLRIVAALPLSQLLVWHFLLTKEGRRLAEENRQLWATGGKVTIGDENGHSSAPLPSLLDRSGSVLSRQGRVPPPFSFVSYSGFADYPLPFVNLHPDIGHSDGHWDEALERFGCDGISTDARNDIRRPPTPMFPRMVGYDLRLAHHIWVVPNLAQMSVRTPRRPFSNSARLHRSLARSTMLYPPSEIPMPLRFSMRDPSISIVSRQGEPPLPTLPGFQQGRSRLQLLYRFILPHYALPLMLVFLGSTIAITGFAPTFLYLNSFKLSPGGDLNYQINSKASPPH
jgi:hypothetical protein